MKFFESFLTSIGVMKKKVGLLCVGLDNSGKSTIVNWFKPLKAPNDLIPPTVGFNVEVFAKARITFTVFDMSGSGRYRDLWTHYVPESDAVIFVVDSADKVRACVARDELWGLIGFDGEDEWIDSSGGEGNSGKLGAKGRATGAGIPLLVLANKNDLEGGMTPAEVAEVLGLEGIRDRNWHVCSCNALTGQGLNQGLDWLIEQLE